MPRIKYSGYLSTILLASALLAVNSLSAVPVSASDDVQHDELDERQYDLELGEWSREPANRVDGVWHRGSGGGTGSNGFYYSTDCRLRAEYFLEIEPSRFDDVYTLSVYVPTSGSNPVAAAIARLVVWQKIDGKWKRVSGSTSDNDGGHRSVYIDQLSGKGWRVPIYRGEPVTWKLTERSVAIQVYRSNDGSRDCNSVLAVDKITLRRTSGWNSADDPGYMPAKSESIFTQ